MLRWLLFICLLVCALALPTPDSELSIFDDESIPIVDQPDLGDLFNFTALARDVGIEKRALNLQYTLYNVNFDGYNRGNAVPFHVSGELMIIKTISSPSTKNGANNIDMVISIGSPTANPTAGSIKYVTNGYLNGFVGGWQDFSRRDYIYEKKGPTSVKMSIDPAVADANIASVFNTRTGRYSDIYRPLSGRFSLVFNGNSMSGYINLAGRGTLYPLTGGVYHAKLGGKAKQRGRITL